MSKVGIVIPARGGSKGIARKNLIRIDGISLLERAILCALEFQKAVASTGVAVETIVSSDDSEMLKVAKSAGATCLRRPNNLALHTSDSWSVVHHVFKKLDFDDDVIVCLLQPTSPFRTPQHLIKAFDLLRSESFFDGVVSVNEIDNSVLKSYFIQDSCLVPISGQAYLNMPRQNLPEVYKANGAIYLYRSIKMLSKSHSEVALAPFFMDRFSSRDIDTIEDLEGLDWNFWRAG